MRRKIAPRAVVIGLVLGMLVPPPAAFAHGHGGDVGGGGQGAVQGGDAVAQAWRLLTLHNGTPVWVRGRGGARYRYVWEERDGLVLGCPDGFGMRRVRIGPDGTRDVVGFACARPGRRPAAGPEVPILDEALRAAPIPVAPVGLNPRVRGLVGLETWLWTDVPEQLVVEAEVEGWKVVTRLWPTMFRWEAGDGAIYTSGRPGSEQRPAARHVYVNDGDYVVTLDVTWSGSYTLTGPGGESDTVEVGEVVVRSERPYTVIQLQAVVGGVRRG